MLKETDQSEQFSHEVVHVLKEWSIYRVPGKLRNVNEAAFTPQLLSIGPFHHKNLKLKDMETHKLQYLEDFLKRSLKSKDELQRFILDKKQNICHCYAGTIEADVEKKFATVILTDACFIIELFLRNSEEGHNKNYYILKSPWMRKAVEQDLILLENQLPYFILEELYAFANSPTPVGSAEALKAADVYRQHFLELTCKFFQGYWKEPTIVHLEKPKHHVEKPKHLTDLVRNFLCPKEEMERGDFIKSEYDVRQLKAAGVKCKPITEAVHYVIKGDSVGQRKRNLAFCTTMDLSLTPFRATYDVECLLRNVMALEQLMYLDQADICSYFLVLDQLVDTVEDVNALVDDKVIVNLLGSSKAVAKLINSLCEQIMERKSCYSVICQQLNDHYKSSKWNRRVANLRQVYFKDLWTGSSTVLGSVVLVFSIIGTVKSLM